ncbi:MAG: hypothetical protein RQ751_10300 [Longimicrobiales bacterium]|nr:hypothetical protein [Longimicrobiales bacterium]
MTTIRTPSDHPATRFRPRALLAVLLAAATGGCDIPTDAPLLETRWVVPSDETRFGVAQLLPGDVRLAEDSTTFLVDFDPVSFSESLGNLCPACVPLNGLTAPKPPFARGFQTAVVLPADVRALELAGGRVEVILTNGLGFDPLRPAPEVYGTLTVTVTDASDGDVLGALPLDGRTTALPPGSILSLSVPLAPGSVGGDLTTRVFVDSPLGDPVTIDVTEEVRASAAALDVQVTAVAAEVGGRRVGLDPVQLDVADVDAEVRDRVTAGAFLLDVENPFGVGGDLTVTLSGGGLTPIVKPARVGPEARSTTRVDFTLDELRSILGRSGVVLSGEVTVDAEAGVATLLPGQELRLAGKLDVTLEVGG